MVYFNVPLLLTAILVAPGGAGIIRKIVVESHTIAGIIEVSVLRTIVLLDIMSLTSARLPTESLTEVPERIILGGGYNWHNIGLRSCRDNNSNIIARTSHWLPLV